MNSEEITKKRKIALSVFSFGVGFSIIGFVLHFIWEYIQCLPFFQHIENSATTGAMVFATAGDIIIMWTVYLMMALVHRSFTWFQEGWNWIVKFSLVGFSVLIAIVVELWAIKTERWAYTVNNPIVPFLDVSILPLMQMALINPISMFGSKIILTSLAKAKLHTKENI